MNPIVVTSELDNAAYNQDLVSVSGPHVPTLARLP